jgi:hypothetical protein
MTIMGTRTFTRLLVLVELSKKHTNWFECPPFIFLGSFCELLRITVLSSTKFLQAKRTQAFLELRWT